MTVELGAALFLMAMVLGFAIGCAATASAINRHYVIIRKIYFERIMENSKG